MIPYRRPLFVFLLAVAALLGLAGCTTDQKDSAIPWSRPAQWENTVPGMGR